MTRDEAVALVKKHGSQRSAAKAAGVARTTFGDIYRGVSVSGRKVGRPEVAKKVAVKKSGKSLDEFRNQYDKDTIIPSKVRAALAELGNAWEYEAEFVRRAGVTFTDLGHYREAFDGNWMLVKSDGKRVWSSKSMIEKMKGML